VEHAGSAGPHVYTRRGHTDDYWRVVQLELCSCSCLPAVLVAATCTGFVQDVHTARYLQLPLPDDPEKTQANNHSAELKQFSCLRLPASCPVVVVTAARKGFTMSQAKYKLIYVYRTDTLEQVCRCPIACCATRSAQWQLSAGWCGTCCMYAQGWCNMLAAWYSQQGLSVRSNTLQQVHRCLLAN
jgi:hypothetical protein